MTDITFADISEFQANLNADAYINAGHKVIIIRAHNGYRPDNTWPSRRDYVRSKPFTAVGYYQYLVDDRDAAMQAREFRDTIGQLEANEFAVCDSEEGTGNQTPRVQAWFDVIDKWQGSQATLYASASWFPAHLTSTAHWGKRPLWIAGYPSSYTPNPAAEPDGCTFWQYSDRGTFPGLSGGVDSNIYHGTAAQFLQRVRPGAQPGPVDEPDDDTLAVVLKANGALEQFVELNTGEVQHRWQPKENAAQWSDWQSMGTPGA
jgi:GH25 family lysozyme M1 (1,4-beta-N-acetylmuramidase)